VTSAQKVRRRRRRDFVVHCFTVLHPYSLPQIEGVHENSISADISVGRTGVPTGKFRSR
jgi:hypothetical protein